MADGSGRVAAFEKAVKKWRGKTVAEEPKTEAEIEIAPETTVPVEEPKDDVLVPSILKPVFVEPEHDEESHKENNKLNEVGERIGAMITAIEPEPAVQPHEMSFSANYISENGLNEKQLFSLMSLFAGKKVKVNIIIQSM